MAHKHTCYDCDAIIAEGDFDCDCDEDHDFELCEICVVRPRCPEGKQGVYNEGYDYAKGETDSGRDNVG